MSRFLLNSLIFTILVALLPLAFCEVETEDLSKDEIIGLTRDHLGRRDPDALLKGFIPVWALVIYMISGTFLVVAVLSGICHLLGCRNKHKGKNIKSFD